MTERSGSAGHSYASAQTETGRLNKCIRLQLLLRRFHLKCNSILLKKIIVLYTRQGGSSNETIFFQPVHHFIHHLDPTADLMNAQLLPECKMIFSYYS